MPRGGNSEGDDEQYDLFRIEKCRCNDSKARACKTLKKQHINVWSGKKLSKTGARYKQLRQFCRTKDADAARYGLGRMKAKVCMCTNLRDACAEMTSTTPYKNPWTGRAIKAGGPKYKEIMALCERYAETPPRRGRKRSRDSSDDDDGGRQRRDNAKKKKKGTRKTKGKKKDRGDDGDEKRKRSDEGEGEGEVQKRSKGHSKSKKPPSSPPKKKTKKPTAKRRVESTAAVTINQPAPNIPPTTPSVVAVTVDTPESEERMRERAELEKLKTMRVRVNRPAPFLVPLQTSIHIRKARDAANESKGGVGAKPAVTIRNVDDPGDLAAKLGQEAVRARESEVASLQERLRHVSAEEDVRTKIANIVPDIERYGILAGKGSAAAAIRRKHADLVRVLGDYEKRALTEKAKGEAAQSKADDAGALATILTAEAVNVLHEADEGGPEVRSAVKHLQREKAIEKVVARVEDTIRKASAVRIAKCTDKKLNKSWNLRLVETVGAPGGMGAARTLYTEDDIPYKGVVCYYTETGKTKLYTGRQYASRPVTGFGLRIGADLYCDIENTENMIEKPIGIFARRVSTLAASNVQTRVAHAKPGSQSLAVVLIANKKQGISKGSEILMYHDDTGFGSGLEGGRKEPSREGGPIPPPQAASHAGAATPGAGDEPARMAISRIPPNSRSSCHLDSFLAGVIAVVLSFSSRFRDILGDTDLGSFDDRGRLTYKTPSDIANHKYHILGDFLRLVNNRSPADVIDNARASMWSGLDPKDYGEENSVGTWISMFKDLFTIEYSVAGVCRRHGHVTIPVATRTFIVPSQHGAGRGASLLVEVKKYFEELTSGRSTVGCPSIVGVDRGKRAAEIVENCDIPMEGVTAYITSLPPIIVIATRMGTRGEPDRRLKFTIPAEPAARLGFGTDTRPRGASKSAAEVMPPPSRITEAAVIVQMAMGEPSSRRRVRCRMGALMTYDDDAGHWTTCYVSGEGGRWYSYDDMDYGSSRRRAIPGGTAVDGDIGLLVWDNLE